MRNAYQTNIKDNFNIIKENNLVKGMLLNCAEESRKDNSIKGFISVLTDNFKITKKLQKAHLLIDRERYPFRKIIATDFL